MACCCYTQESERCVSLRLHGTQMIMLYCVSRRPVEACAEVNVWLAELELLTLLSCLG